MSSTITQEHTGLEYHDVKKLRHPPQKDEKPIASQPQTNPWSPLSLPYTLWLFTESDFFTFAIPDTAFGVFGALAGPLLTTQNDSHSLLTILSRIPYVLLSNWLNLLVFDLANQLVRGAAAEDGLNKPWRPIPSGRISPNQARRLFLAVLPITIATNYVLGVAVESLALVMLTYMYNDLEGGDDHFVLRNLIISVAFGVYHEGSLRIASGSATAPVSITSAGWVWLGIISGVILTTMHVQDMKDIVGDRVRGRHSAPLVLGDRAVRWTIAVPVIIWSFICPAFWDLEWYYYFISLGIGSVVIARILLLRTTRHDRVTWQIWAGWTVSLYLLPIFNERSLLLQTL